MTDAGGGPVGAAGLARSGGRAGRHRINRLAPQLAHGEHETYRGVYEWDGAARAEHYARALWRVLALVCEPGSIDYRVLPGTRRDVLRGPSGPSASPIGTSDPADGRLVAMCWQGATPSRGAGE